MLLIAIKTVGIVVLSLYAMGALLLLVVWVWDRAGFARDQSYWEGRLSAFDDLEASWRLPAYDPERMS